jgi:hypothetical protein
VRRLDLQRASLVIIRTYQCEDCGLQFEIELESGNDPDPDCPDCSKVLDWVPGLFAIGTVKSRAVDFTQKVIEEDFGLTNLNDGNREGDVAFKPAAEMQTAERENIEQAVREFVRETTQPVPTPTGNLPPQAQAAPVGQNFWGASPAGIAANPVPASLMLAGAKTGPQFPDYHPMKLLQEGIKSGHLQTKARIISRWRP